MQRPLRVYPPSNFSQAIASTRELHGSHKQAYIHPPRLTISLAWGSGDDGVWAADSCGQTLKSRTAYRPAFRCIFHLVAP